MDVPVIRLGSETVSGRCLIDIVYIFRVHELYSPCRERGMGEVGGRSPGENSEGSKRRIEKGNFYDGL